MILLAESGSTKTEWCLSNTHGIAERCMTDGINPAYQTRKEISRIIRLQLPASFFRRRLRRIYFYGTGCDTYEKNNIVRASLETQFKTSALVDSDLVGSSRALFGDRPGVVCIMGSGANSCFYNGNDIVNNVRTLGYILGEEGSAASLGQIFLGNCLKNLAPEELIEPFYKKYKINPDEIIDYIYTTPAPGKLLSVLSLFLSENISHPYVYDLVEKNIRDYFTRNILQYDYANFPVKIIGTIGSTYSEIVHKVTNELGINIDSIEESAIPGLVDYHYDHDYI